MNKEKCMELMSRPASSLTALEQYVLYKFCDEHPDIVEMMITSTPAPSQQVAAPKKRYVYGLDGIMEIFGCSKTTAQKIKNEGRIDKAITQVGRKIIIDAEMALSCYSLSPKMRNRR